MKEVYKDYVFTLLDLKVTEDPKREQYTKDGLRLYLMKKKC